MSRRSGTPPFMSDDWRAELSHLVAAARAHVEVELELGSDGLALPPPPPPPPSVVNAAARPAVPAAAAPSAAVSVATDSPAAEGDRRRVLAQLAEAAAACTACELHLRRKQSVFARGNPDAEIVFVGEGPGQEEDLRGLPFVGPAGQLLDRMIDAMGLRQDEVYICNVVKCRPPENRTPRPEEAIACAQFLQPQIACIAPKIVVALGRCAAEHLGLAQATGSWRGRWGSYRGIPALPTYHPAFLLRSPEFKRVVWDDLQQVVARLGRVPKGRTRA